MDGGGGGASSGGGVASCNFGGSTRGGRGHNGGGGRSKKGPRRKLLGGGGGNDGDSVNSGVGQVPADRQAIQDPTDRQAIPSPADWQAVQDPADRQAIQDPADRRAVQDFQQWVSAPGAPDKAVDAQKNFEADGFVPRYVRQVRHFLRERDRRVPSPRVARSATTSTEGDTSAREGAGYDDDLSPHALSGSTSRGIFGGGDDRRDFVGNDKEPSPEQVCDLPLRLGMVLRTCYNLRDVPISAAPPGLYGSR